MGTIRMSVKSIEVTVGGRKVASIEEFEFEQTIDEPKPRARRSRLPPIAEQKQADWFNQVWNKKRLKP